MVADHGSPTHLAAHDRSEAGIALVSPRCRLAGVKALSRSRCRPHFTEAIVGKIFFAVGIVTLCDHVLSVGHSDCSGGGLAENILFRAGRLGTMTGVIGSGLTRENVSDQRNGSNALGVAAILVPHGETKQCGSSSI